MLIAIDGLVPLVSERPEEIAAGATDVHTLGYG